MHIDELQAQIDGHAGRAAAAVERAAAAVADLAECEKEREALEGKLQDTSAQMARLQAQLQHLTRVRADPLQLY